MITIIANRFRNVFWHKFTNSSKWDSFARNKCFFFEPLSTFEFYFTEIPQIFPSDLICTLDWKMAYNSAFKVPRMYTLNWLGKNITFNLHELKFESIAIGSGLKNHMK